ncbi:MAG TPA: diguanylate cyclase [Thermoanaerobaculia bacterium]|nr:diguanylate cyclase [Thermoanaerobaculia bacterium]
MKRDVDLRPPVVSASRLVGVALSALVVAMLLLGAVYSRRASHRMIGITVDPGGEGPGIHVADVAPGAPADRAGVRRGDTVVAVAGEPVHDDGDYDRVAAAFPTSGAVPFTVRRDGREVLLELVPGRPFPWRDFLVSALTALAYLGIALLTLRQQRADLRARLLFLFTLAVAVEFALPYAASGATGDLVFMVFSLLTGIQMGLELHLASVIPEPHPWLRRRPWLVKAFYGAGILMGGGAALGILVRDLWGWPLPWTTQGANWLLFEVGVPLWALAVPLILLQPAMRHPQAQGRHQAALVLAGVLPWTTTTMISWAHTLTGGLPPRWLEIAEPIALLCYPIAVFIAISRYQLFDMELVVRRSLLYAALTTTLLLVFYAALGAGGVLFSEFVEGGNRVWVVATATLALGLAFTPLRRFLESLIYRRFFPERVALRERLVGLAGELPAVAKLPLMGQRLVRGLEETLAVRWATLFIAEPRSGLLMPLASTLPAAGEGLEHSLLLSPDDPGLRLLTQSGRAFSARQLAAKSTALAQRLETLRATVAVPLLHQDQLVGLLLLGPKASGDRYVAEEMELLTLFGQHAAVVFENARLFESATRDSLTGIWRREAVLEQLEAELQRARRYDRPLAVGMADLDHFKQVNDRHGHLLGDSILKWVAHLLASGLRNTDSIGRYGGEEFLFVLPETDLEGAVNVAEKARALVEQQPFETEAGEAIPVTLSIGLASLRDLGDRAPTLENLIDAADRSLYDAKGEGRNLVRPRLAFGA